MIKVIFSFSLSFWVNWMVGCRVIGICYRILLYTIYICVIFFCNYLCDIRRRQWQPTPVLLPGKYHGGSNLVGCSPWGPEESDTAEQLHFHFSLSRIGEGNGKPLQCSCLENPRDGVTQSRTRLKQFSSSMWYYIINLVLLGLSFLLCKSGKSSNAHTYAAVGRI